MKKLKDIDITMLRGEFEKSHAVPITVLADANSVSVCQEALESRHLIRFIETARQGDWNEVLARINIHRQRWDGEISEPVEKTISGLEDHPYLRVKLP